MDKRRARIREVLEKLYAKYNRRALIKPDPLQFVYAYSGAGDMEVAAFVASSLAYGRVQQIERSVGRLLGLMGSSPYSFVRDFGARERAKLAGFKHRFTTGEDISDLLVLLKGALVRHGSIEGLFLEGYDEGEETVVGALSRFCDGLCEGYARRHGGRVSRGLMYLLASPSRGSASKRLNLFLRWVVRDDAVDSGLWKSVDPAKLIVPVDVHVGRLCRILGFYERKSVSLSTALEITRAFAELEPGDPVKYDFALSRIGVVEDCNGRRRNECELCELLEFCLRREDWSR